MEHEAKRPRVEGPHHSGDPSSSHAASASSPRVSSPPPPPSIIQQCAHSNLCKIYSIDPPRPLPPNIKVLDQTKCDADSIRGISANSLKFIETFSNAVGDARDYLESDTSDEKELRKLSQELRDQNPEDVTVMMSLADEEDDGEIGEDEEDEAIPVHRTQTDGVRWRRQQQKLRPKIDQLNPSEGVKRRKEAISRGVPSNLLPLVKQALYLCRIDTAFLHHAVGWFPPAIRSLLFETAPDTVADHLLSIFDTPEAAQWVLEQVIAGGVKKLPTFPTCDRTDFDGGHYLKGGPSSIADGGPAVLDINEGLRRLEKGQTVGLDRKGRTFQGQLFALPPPASLQDPPQPELPLVKTSLTQDYVGTGDGADGIAGRIVTHERSKVAGDQPAVTDLVGRGSARFPIPASFASLSKTAKLKYWRLTRIPTQKNVKIYSYQFTLLGENVLVHLLGTLRGQDVITFSSFLLKTPSDNLRFDTLSSTYLYPTNVAFPLHAFVHKASDMLERRQLAFKQGFICNATVPSHNLVNSHDVLLVTLPRTPSLPHISLGLKASFFTQDHFKWEVGNVGTVGAVRVSLLGPEKYCLTDVDGAIDLSPAIRGLGDDNLQRWTLHTIVDLGEERRRCVTLKSMGLPEDWFAAAKEKLDYRAAHPPAAKSTAIMVNEREQQLGDAWSRTVTLRSSQTTQIGSRSFVARPRFGTSTTPATPNIHITLPKSSTFPTTQVLESLGDLQAVLINPTAAKPEDRWSFSFTQRPGEVFNILTIMGQQRRVDGILLKLWRDLGMWATELENQRKIRERDS